MDEFVDEILKLANVAFELDEVPVGAVVVSGNKIVGKGYNTRENSNDVLGHAEIMAIKNASENKKTWKLNDCDLYVTLKPCSMCESVIRQSRIRNVYYLTEKLDFKKEYNKTNVRKIENVTDYELLLKKFFEIKRNK
ncbi:MAG: nucleoside deaminase [Firmicutes bacterium]|nr:nucleoside deaminase [Bacillota bacterium]